jgi:hypothetical protein
MQYRDKHEKNLANEYDYPKKVLNNEIAVGRNNPLVLHKSQKDPSTWAQENIVVLSED